MDNRINILYNACFDLVKQYNANADDLNFDAFNAALKDVLILRDEIADRDIAQGETIDGNSGELFSGWPKMSGDYRALTSLINLADGEFRFALIEDCEQIGAKMDAIENAIKSLNL